MGRVLLVNDSRFESIIMKDILGEMGYNVAITDEYDALKQVRNFYPDYVIVNYIMKQYRGDQLISIIKVQYPAVKCLLSSSNAIDSREFRLQKIDAVIHTPATRASLEDAFRNMEGRAGKDSREAGEGSAAAKQADTAKAKDTGTPAQEHRTCPGCGKSLDEVINGGFAFCPFCGHKM